MRCTEADERAKKRQINIGAVSKSTDLFRVGKS